MTFVSKSATVVDTFVTVVDTIETVLSIFLTFVSWFVTVASKSATFVCFSVPEKVRILANQPFFGRVFFGRVKYV